MMLVATETPHEARLPTQDQMTVIDAIILGIVEGITEFLPVSSTGHLIITAWLLSEWGQLDANPKSVDTFNIVIQGGAILAVIGIFRVRIWQMICGIFGRAPAGRKLFFNLIIAFIPALILGPLLDDWIEYFLFRPVPVLAALFIGGLVLLGMRRWQNRIYGAQDEKPEQFVDLDDLTWKSALIIGLLQCVAMWPGTSRSMMTIVGGMFMGLRPRQAAEFSFLLGLPTLGGACVYKLAKEYLKGGSEFIDGLGGWTPFIVGTITAAFAAAVAVKWLIDWLSTHSLALFGWWRIGIATILGFAIFSGWVSIDRPESPIPEKPVKDTDIFGQQAQPPSTWVLFSPSGSWSPASSTPALTARSTDTS